MIQIRFDGFVLSPVTPYGITEHPSDNTVKECSQGKRVSIAGVLRPACVQGIEAEPSTKALITWPQLPQDVGS